MAEIAEMGQDYKMSGFNIKLALGLTNKKNCYKSEAGNGTKIKKYFWNKEKSEAELLIKKDGTPDYDNLYAKIQLQKDSTNYKKLINKNSSLDELKMIFDKKNPYDEQYIDSTNIGDTEQMKKTENEINAKFGNMENFQNFTKQKLANYQNQIKLYKTHLENQKKKNEARHQKLKDEFNEWMKNNKK